MNRKIIFRIAIALLAFIVGTTGVYLWLKSHPPIESFDEVDMSAVPSVEYCEMRNNPDKYSGKVIRIDADMYWFMHGYFLYNENCAGTSDDKYLIDYGRTAILFNDAQADKIVEAIEPTFGKGRIHGFLRINAVGRFTYGRPEGYSDGSDDRTAFHFEVYSVDSAELIRLSLMNEDN